MLTRAITALRVKLKAEESQLPQPISSRLCPLLLSLLLSPLYREQVAARDVQYMALRPDVVHRSKRSYVMADNDFAKRFEITSPCTEDWDAMLGNDRIRFCSHCQRSVHDLSQLNRKQIRRLILKSNGRLCVRYSAVNPKPPATPARVLYKIGRRTSIIAASAFSASLSISSAIAANSQKIDYRAYLRDDTSVRYSAIYNATGATAAYRAGARRAGGSLRAAAAT